MNQSVITGLKRLASLACDEMGWADADNEFWQIVAPATDWIESLNAHGEDEHWLSDPERSEVIDVLSKVLSLPAGCLSDEEALEEARDMCERLQRHASKSIANG